ncbi:MAG: hypothetical protein Q8940_18995 [Bacteroidota bacterium]|nr:hypothetical protein [Bacteroidota bacterium]
MKQYLETTYDTVGGKDTCFIYQMWAPEKPILQLGDTIAVVISAKYDYNGSPLIYDKPVYVTITTGFGDKETYWLKGKLLPGQTKLIDIEIFHGLISYNTFYVSHPSKEDNFLEIRPTGDTLIASYQSYCSGNIIKDTVVILPK